MMNIDSALKEWQSKKRSMGCVSATNWFCKRVGGFSPRRKIYFTHLGDEYQHVVASNDLIEIDLMPHRNVPDVI